MSDSASGGNANEDCWLGGNRPHTNMEPLIAYLSVFFVASLVAGVVLYRHSIAAVILCPLVSFAVFLLRRDWSDFDGPAIWSTSGSTSSWVIGLSVWFILHGFASVVGAAVGLIVGQRLIGRRTEHYASK